MTAIMDLIDDDAQRYKERIRKLYTSLKTDLRTVYKRGNTKRGREEMSEIEKVYFHPAITQAYCHLSASTNSDPINSNWHSDLYGARIDINYLLRQLESQYPESP